MNSLYGLFNLNIELSDRCNKNCSFCGRRKRERENPNIKLYYGDIEFSLLEKISKEVPPNIIVQFHNNGECSLYPKLKEAIQLFKGEGRITNFVTNGKLIIEKSDEIIDNLDTISISIIQGDPEWEEQYILIEKFLELKKDKKPFTTLRFVGKVDESRYGEFSLLKVRRVLHDPNGSINYKKSPTIPEHGICEDFLHHLAINRFGQVSTCVRFDKDGELVLGNSKYYTLQELWSCEKRLEMKKLHVEGKRHLIPYCGNKCHFYGVPTGY